MVSERGLLHMGNAKERIESGKAVLGIEFGSTRIKAVLVDETHQPIASGAHDWENQLVDGIWTYSLDMIWDGLRDCYRKMTEDVQNKYGVAVTKLGAIGFSGMMHGYMPFDEKGELLVPFRTWRNTITGEAAAALTKEFSFNIPQRWSIAHLYQAILNGEEHVDKIALPHLRDTFTGNSQGRRYWESARHPVCSLSMRRQEITTGRCWRSLMRFLR